MNLAEKITMLRKRAGWSQEELAERLDVTRQSCSKWEGGQSVPEIDKILRMSELFHVTTDYLLKEEEETSVEAGTAMGREAFSQPAGDEEKLRKDKCRRVTLEDAEAYLSTEKAMGPKRAVAVFLCIVSPVVLLLLAAMSELSSFSVSENAAAGVGLAVLLLLVAAGAGLFIFTGAKVKEFEFLETEAFALEQGVEEMVRRRRKAYRPAYSRFNILGTVLCILSAVPLFGVVCVTESEFWGVTAVCALLFLVGLGVAAFVYGNTYQNAMDRLLEEGDYTPRKKSTKTVRSTISLVYWLVVTAIFLYYTFGPNGNGQMRYSWVIWAIAGVLFGAVMGVVSLIQSGGKEK